MLLGADTRGRPLANTPTFSGGPVDAGLIEDLVAASRILAHYGVLDAWGHVSIRHPANPERYLLSRARAPALVSAEDIMEFDLDSNPIDQRDRRVFLERFIHGQAYRARPDVNAVVHSHSPTMIPFSVTGEPLKALSHIASFLVKEVPVWEVRDAGITQGLLVTSNVQGRSLAEKLGDGPVALMRGHGNVVVAPDIKRVVHRALYTEVNAQQLVTALSFKRPITFISPDEAQDPKRLDDSWEVWKVEAMGE
ncbi:MAG: class II aldolase/adducin family protein [Rhizobiales bacterium]|nr:class II aldolase/adducin family protein [Hyphomicrobiales bacterium]